MTKKYEVALFLTAIFWGLGFVFMDLALVELNTFSILTLRFIGAGGILLILNIANISKIVRRDWINGSILGIFLFLAFALQTYGLMFTTASRNAFLTAANVVFVPFLLYVLFRQKIEKKVVVGSVIMLLGIGFVSGLSFSGINIGDMLTLASAIFFALHIIYIGKSMDGKNLINLVTIQLLTAGILSLVTGLLTNSLSITGIGNVWFPVLYVILFSTLLTFFLQNYGLAYVDSSKGAVILATEALFGTLGSIIILNEEMSILMILGFCLMFIGIVVVERE
ncbi:DMT family transporter [Mollicutes bacterium LVI A0039]|nr:DMT family transporter [Mollicutes bacterium LVI A0039]